MCNIQNLTEELKTGTTVLAAARSVLYDRTEAEIAARTGLKNKTAQLLALGADGPVNGKNAEIREAQIRANTSTERIALELAEAQRRNAAYKLEVALDRMALLQNLVQLSVLGHSGNSCNIMVQREA